MLDAREQRIDAIRRQVKAGEYPNIVTERMLDAILDDVRTPREVIDAELLRLADDIEAGLASGETSLSLRRAKRAIGFLEGEDIPPVVTGQGSYLRPWPNDGEHPGPLVPGTCDRMASRPNAAPVWFGLSIVGAIVLACAAWRWLT